jgi:GNAT superfamily N-acetyltransferase
MTQEKTLNGILYSGDKTLLQPDVIHDYLCGESYWAKGIPRDLLMEAIRGSMCFGVYENEKQIGFARVVTDGATFGYLADVFVLEEYRGKGISKELMRFIMEQPVCKKFRRFMLATKDAHGLYARFGFKALASPERFMEIKPFENYSQIDH